jgi:hypothetical protein
MLCFSCILYLEYRAAVSRLYMPLLFSRNPREIEAGWKQTGCKAPQQLHDSARTVGGGCGCLIEKDGCLLIQCKGYLKELYCSCVRTSLSPSLFAVRIDLKEMSQRAATSVVAGWWSHQVNMRFLLLFALPAYWPDLLHRYISILTDTDPTSVYHHLLTNKSNLLIGVGPSLAS